MDIIDTPPYTDMQRLYSRYFSLGYLNPDINTKFALISLICYLTDKIKSKKPDTTHYQIIRKIKKIFVHSQEDYVLMNSMDLYVT